jgi:putative sigma-54 modulation protein
MNISITARKFKAHSTLKEYIQDEVKSLNKFNDDILNADVILSYQNMKESLKNAEIVLQVPGQTLTATEESDDFTKSVSAAVAKLSRQLKKLKTKRITRNVK